MLSKLLVVLGFSVFAFGASAGQAIPQSSEDVCPIKVGQSLPPLSLKNSDGKTVNLNKSVADKPAILIFYRGSWCPYCNTHLGELKTIEGKLKSLGYQIIALSPDLPENLKKSVDKNDLDYQLLSDSKAEAAKALGLAYKVDEATYKMLVGYNINLEQASGEKHHILPVPAAVLVGTDGAVKFIFSSPDYKVRIDTKVLLAAAESYAE